MLKKKLIAISIIIILILPLIGKKKFSFEVFLGISKASFNDLYQSENGDYNYLKQYANLLNLSINESGSFSHINSFTPISVTVLYPFKKKFNLRFSLEYNQGKSDGEKTYAIQWTDFDELHKYSYKYIVSNVITMLGIEYKTGKFIFFTDIGFNSANLTHETEMFYTEADNIFGNKNTFTATGSGIALSFGAKYLKKIKKFATLVLKAEIFLSQINEFPGSINSSWTNPIDGNTTDSMDGNLYIYETNPYETSWFKDMGFFSSSPNSEIIRNAKQLSLSFSTIKFAIGFRF